MLRVHKQPGKFIAVLVKAEENADSHVVNAALHGAVHGLGVIVVIMFRPCGVERQVALLVVGLLEQDISADFRLLKQSVVVCGGGGDIDVDTADGAVFMLDVIYRFNAVKIIFHGIMHRVFPRL